ncbi:hypothetical protein P7K49_040779 [Saguinus oedipus]|uniref:Uncharacterized protein n=1 Tax=Saguinus oedipus TaxID=9490 RepID=A0ABQ9T901_SAGOE|nr:hypothetical protein P7K49_040779 [Saguinus oedipus]
MPSDPESSGQSRPGCPPHGLKRPPHPADSNRKVGSGRSGWLGSAQLVAGRLLPWVSLRHRRRHSPVPLRPPCHRAPRLPLASRTRQCACACASGASQVEAPTWGSRHSDSPRGLWNRLSSFENHGPSVAVPGRWATAPLSQRSLPGSRDFRSRAGWDQAEKSFSGVSGMSMAIPKDPHGASGLLRCCGGYVSLKPVPTGISRYRQPVCSRAALSQTGFPEENRTPQP